MVSLSPEGAKRGVQTQGAHHAPRAGTQRPQKHAARNTVQEFGGGVGTGAWLCLRACLRFPPKCQTKHDWDHTRHVFRVSCHNVRADIRNKHLKKWGGRLSAVVCHWHVLMCVAPRHVKGGPGQAGPLAWGDIWTRWCHRQVTGRGWQRMKGG